MTEVVFITGNQYKADYFERQMGLPIPHQKVDLDEIQSTDLHEIVDHKVRQAYGIVRKPVVVEDVSLEFTALGGLPGPFIKFFVERSGLEACCRLLDAFEDRTATIRTTFGYYDGEEVCLFDSAMPGFISQHPKGDSGFGFDAIFVRSGDSITLAEYPQDENERIYAEEKKPFGAVREFLQSLDNS